MMQLAVMNANDGGSMALRQQHHAFRILGLFSLLLIVSAVIAVLAGNYAGPHPTSDVHSMKWILHHKAIPGDEMLENTQQEEEEELSYVELSAAGSRDDLSDEPPMLEDESHDDPFEVIRHLKKASKKKVQTRFRTTKAPRTKGRMEETGKGKGGGRTSRAPSGPRSNFGKGKQVKSLLGKGKRRGKGGGIIL